MDEEPGEPDEEKALYYGIILACIIGIVITSVMLYQSTPQEEEFSELYFYFERIDLVNGKGTFHECTVEVATTIWIDLDSNGTQTDEETFLPGDTFVLNNEFWNIADVAKDSSQILFGKFPKIVAPGDINFAFVIVNHLLTDHEYEYTITVNGTAYKETVFIKTEEKQLIFQSVLIKNEGEYRISVSLDTGEEIYFYITVRSEITPQMALSGASLVLSSDRDTTQ